MTPVHEIRLARGFVQLREVRGADEMALSGTDTRAALALLDELFVDAPGVAVRPGEAETLAVAERDRVVAALHARTFGPRIATSVRCGACGEKFDLDFSLDELVANVQPEPVEPEVTLPGGRRARLPNGADELAVRGRPPEEAERLLARRCVPDLAEDADAGALVEALAALGPVIDLDLDAPCPECGGVNQVRFSAQEYFLGALAAERRILHAEVHLLARAYGWGLGEILSLPRAHRRAFVDLVDAERIARRAR